MTENQAGSRVSLSDHANRFSLTSAAALHIAGAWLTFLQIKPKGFDIY
jgi:hypothetical protein